MALYVINVTEALPARETTEHRTTQLTFPDLIPTQEYVFKEVKEWER